jgi:hypothetical protein
MISSTLESPAVGWNPAERFNRQERDMSHIVASRFGTRRDNTSFQNSTFNHYFNEMNNYRQWHFFCSLLEVAQLQIKWSECLKSAAGEFFFFPGTAEPPE